MFKKLLRNWLNKDAPDRSIKYASNSITLNRGRDDEPEDFNLRSTVRFHLTPARGGAVLTVRHYNQKSDDYENTVHVLHNDQDIAHEVGQIVSMELLRS